MESGEILQAVSVEQLVQLAEVDHTTARRWKRGTARLPAAVARLVAMRYLGDLAALAGPDWTGWRITRDGHLASPRWRRPFERWEIEEMPVLHGIRAGFDVERRQLASDLARARQELQHEKKRAAFYRAQLVSESRIGLALLIPR